MSNRIRVGVVDDHPLFRDGVVYTLASQPDIEVVAQGATAGQAIQIATEHKPDVIVLDLNMPGGGITAVESISLRCPMTKLLMLTVSSDDDQVCTALKHGAQGYLLKGSGGSELVQAVRLLSQGESYVSPSLGAKLLARFSIGAVAANESARPFSHLSAREEQILSHLAQGLSNKEIGNQLVLSEKTIKHYVTSILQKLRVRNRVEAAIYASDRLSQHSSNGMSQQKFQHIQLGTREGGPIPIPSGAGSIGQV